MVKQLLHPPRRSNCHSPKFHKRAVIPFPNSNYAIALPFQAQILRWSSCSFVESVEYEVSQLFILLSQSLELQLRLYSIAIDDIPLRCKHIESRLLSSIEGSQNQRKTFLSVSRFPDDRNSTLFRLSASVRTLEIIHNIKILRKKYRVFGYLCCETLRY